MYRQPNPSVSVDVRLHAFLLALIVAAVPAVLRAQAAPSEAAPGLARQEPRYPRSTAIPEDMIRRRPRQVIALPSEPGEYGEDPLQLSSGVLGKFPPEVHRLPEGYVVASQEMAVEQQADWYVCYLPDERLIKLSLDEAGVWPGDLEAGRLPSGLVAAAQGKGVTLAPESKIHIEEKGRRWRVADPRRTLIVEKDAGSMVVRSALALRLLPNKRLSMLEAVLAGTDRMPNFAFTGPVTEFQGNNYLLTEHLAEVVEAPPPSPAGETDATDETPPADRTEGAIDTAPAGPAGEPRPEDIIKQLLEKKPRRALVLPQTMPSAVQRPLVPGPGGEAATEQALPEETLLVDQPGRVVPADDKWWIFSFEDRGRQANRRPVRLLPNRMLENAIALTGDESMGVILVVSGEMTEYRGTNYLLLRKVLVQRDWGNLR